MRKYKRGKNSRIKKLLAGILVLCMGMVLWAGCGSQSEEKQSSLRTFLPVTMSAFSP